MPEIHESVSSLTLGEKVSTTNLVELFEHLDSLWTKYLDYLDSYTSAQKALQKRLSSGYFSLARANFTARDGRRYGKDYYHERAFATWRVANELDDESSERAHLVVKWTNPSEELTQDEAAGGGSSKSSSSLVDSVSESAGDGNNREDTVKTTSTEDLPQGESTDVTGGTKKRAPLEADPLRWFGMLVPRELRDAHASFSSIFENPVADAVNAARGMREIEAQIRKTRKDIRKAEKAGLQ